MIICFSSCASTLVCICHFYRTKPVEKPKELVIPLIHKNRWYRQDAERGDKSEDKSRDPSLEKKQDTVESQAVKELIEGVLVDHYSFCRLRLCFKTYQDVYLGDILGHSIT